MSLRSNSAVSLYELNVFNLALYALNSKLVGAVRVGAGVYTVEALEVTIRCERIIINSRSVVVEVERLNNGESISSLFHSSLQSIVCYKLTLVDHLRVVSDCVVNIIKAVLEYVVIGLQSLVSVVKCLVDICGSLIERCSYVVLILLILVCSSNPVRSSLTSVYKCSVVNCEDSSIASLVSKIVALLKQFNNLCLCIGCTGSQIILVRQCILEVSVNQSPLRSGALSSTISNLTGCADGIETRIVSNIGLVAVDVHLSDGHCPSKVYRNVLYIVLAVNRYNCGYRRAASLKVLVNTVAIVNNQVLSRVLNISASITISLSSLVLSSCSSQITCGGLVCTGSCVSSISQLYFLLSGGANLALNRDEIGQVCCRTLADKLV